jgi:hypothetical protein
MITLLQARSRLLVAIVAMCSAIGLVVTTASVSFAQDDGPWKVRGKLVGKPKDVAGLESRKSSDVSGIACATTAGFPRICLIADDETQGAQVVILKDGELVAGDFIRLIEDAHDSKPLELDAEGVAYADGYFYVVGWSHGRPRHEEDAKKEANNKAKAAASRRVFRVRFAENAVNLSTGELSTTPDIKGSSELSRLIKAQAELAPWFDEALDENGLTIEGIAVRAGLLNVGMRGPVLTHQSLI